MHVCLQHLNVMNEETVKLVIAFVMQLHVHAGFLLLLRACSACVQQLAATISLMVCSRTKSPETLLVS